MTIENRAWSRGSDIWTLSVADHGGMTIERVSAPDFTDNPRYSDARTATQTELADINEQLDVHSHWPAPQLTEEGGELRLEPNNPVAEPLFAAAPSLKTWREKLVPSAMALTALYEAESWTLPTGEPIDTKTRDLFLHSLDAIGIRSRAAIMCDIARRHIASEAKVTEWTSLACVAAIPVLDAVEAYAIGTDVHLNLIDIDDNTLDHACQQATDRGLEESVHFDLLNRNVVKDLIVSDNLVHELGADSQQLVDMLGIFEHVQEDFRGFKSAAAILANAFRLVRPGGVLVAANMLDTRPQIHFNQRAIGWPEVFPRSLDQIHDIITDAGIDPRWVTVRILEDGIYAVFEICKPDHTDFDFDKPIAA